MSVPPPLKSIVVNGKKKVAINGVVNINASAKGGVQPDWNQNDATKPDYIKNRPFYETTTSLFPDTTFKFNEQGSLPSIGFATDEPVLVNGDQVSFESSNPNILIQSNGGSISPDGKAGGFSFTIYDLNGSSQGGGAGSLSYDGDANKYIFAISGGGNPAVCANLEFTMTRQHYKKLDSNLIDIDDDTIKLSNDKLSVNASSTTLTNKFAEKITYNNTGGYQDVNIAGITITNETNWDVKLRAQKVKLPTGNIVSIICFEIWRLNSDFIIDQNNPYFDLATINVTYSDGFGVDNKNFISSLCRWGIATSKYTDQANNYQEVATHDPILGGMFSKWWVGNELKKLTAVYNNRFTSTQGTNGFTFKLGVQVLNSNDPDFYNTIPVTTAVPYAFSTKPIILI